MSFAAAATSDELGKIRASVFHRDGVVLKSPERGGSRDPDGGPHAAKESGRVGPLLLGLVALLA